MVLARPQAGEFSSGLQASYIERVSGEVDPVPALSAQRDSFLSLLRSVSEARSVYRYGPDKWSIKQVLGHLADAERIFGYRLLRIARGDETALPGFDEDSYAEMSGADGRSFDSLIEEWSSVRAA